MLGALRWNGKRMNVLSIFYLEEIGGCRSTPSAFLPKEGRAFGRKGLRKEGPSVSPKVIPNTNPRLSAGVLEMGRVLEHFCEILIALSF